jgi:hypothetical protein
MRPSHLCASVFICGSLLCSILSSVARADEPQFTISYWCGPHGKFNTLERYQEIKDANFTLAFPSCGGMSVDDNRKMLDYCQSVGLKALVMDGRMVHAIGGSEANKNTLDAIIKDYSDHPALFGYHIVDEPGAGAFPGLGEVVAYLKEKDPKHPGYINLLPTYGRDFGVLGTATYEEHVRKYADIVKPFAISYDHYHFTYKGGDRPDFFENLWTVRKVALEHKLPFWNIVLVTQHFDYRHLNEAELRFEAMQTLAFGAKGLLWFTYWMPAIEGWKHSIINADGTRDPHYDIVKKINADVLAIGNELIKCDSTEVFQPGTAVTTAPSIAANSPPRKPSANSPIKVLDEADLTVGVFKAKDDKRLALIANRNYKGETKSRALVQPVNAAVEVFDPARKLWSQAPIRERGVVDLSLPAGGAMLIRW